MSIVELCSKDAFVRAEKVDHSHFEVPLRQPLHNVYAMQLLSAIVPFSWYVINETNNTFVCVFAGGVDTTVTIPEGTYSSSQLAQALTTAMVHGTNSVTVTYDGITDKFTFAAGSAITIKVADMVASLKKVLGLDYQTNQTGTSVQSNAVPQVTGGDVITLNFDNIQIDTQNSSKQSNSIVIPLNANYHGMIEFDNNSRDELIHFTSAFTIHSLKVRLTYFGNESLGGSRNTRGAPVYPKIKFFIR